MHEYSVDNQPYPPGYIPVVSDAGLGRLTPAQRSELIYGPGTPDLELPAAAVPKLDRPSSVPLAANSDGSNAGDRSAADLGVERSVTVPLSARAVQQAGLAVVSHLVSGRWW